MIQRLYIKDFAIIDEIDIDLRPGLTVITGETGSGKSIILEALSVCLGAKADKIMVRNGSKRAIVETVFKKHSYRRLISQEGRTKAFKNDEPITLGNLIKSDETKVDFHGQHDQQLILDSDRHIDYLDRYCGHEKEVANLSKLFFELSELRLKLKHLQQSATQMLEHLDLLKFQANEIDSIDPKIDEDFLLDTTYKRLSHLEETLRTLRNLQASLTLGDQSITDQVAKSLHNIESLEKYDQEINKISILLQSSMIQLQEAGAEISIKLSESEFDPNELSLVEDRIQSLETLKRKYGGSIEAVIDKRKLIDQEVRAIRSTEDSEKDIMKMLNVKEQEFSKIAIDIHKRRIERSKGLSSKIESKMAELNMLDAKFEIRITQDRSDNGFITLNNKSYSHNPNGIDSLEFFLSANPGEPVKPLVNIASGGEVSRIMLAIKTVFQDVDPVETLVFDEIDSGISGQAAEKVAKQLLQLSSSKQIFCITHLSQIAKKADNHLHILKHVKDGITFVNVKYLNEIEAPRVIDQMFLGIETVSV